MVFTYEDKMKLKEDIIKLSKYDWINIYNDILKKNDESYTINNAGLFFDLINISNQSLDMIKNYINNQKTNQNQN